MKLDKVSIRYNACAKCIHVLQDELLTAQGI